MQNTKQVPRGGESGDKGMSEKLSHRLQESYAMADARAFVACCVEVNTLGDRLAEAEAKIKLAECVVDEWLSDQPGNAEWRERFYYALGLDPPSWLKKWDDDYAEKKQYYFKHWIEERRAELGIKEAMPK